MTTDRLYYIDSYLRDFEANILEAADSGRRLYLDRTAFYPSSGGQLHDIGTLGGVPVIEVVDEEDRIAHVLTDPVLPGPVRGFIDWTRRFDFMQQHSGQHLLSAVFHDRFGLATISVHMGTEVSTVDLDTASLTPAQIVAAEEIANQIVTENRSISVTFAEASGHLGLRKAVAREGTIRIVSIDDLDRSACGGTHVRATGEIGAILIRKLEKIRGSVRLEFLCGSRALRRARQDFDILSRISLELSASPEETPDLVHAQQGILRDSAKLRKKLEADLSVYQGRELYQATSAGQDGIRRILQREANGSLETIRSLATSACAQPKAVFAAVIENPPSVLLACSADSGMDANAILKPLLAAAGGRGGGSARLAQGSVPSREALEAVLAQLPCT